MSNKYNIVNSAMESSFALPPLDLPKTRSGKIMQFQHYQTDAPV